MTSLWARTDDPGTSHAAGEDSVRRQAIRLTLLMHYARAAVQGRGMTDEEAMQEAGYDMADDGHRRRCSDLRREGLIEQVSLDGIPQNRRSERTGKSRMVCTITHTGIDVLDGLGLL